jgi:hypothetical protein
VLRACSTRCLLTVNNIDYFSGVAYFPVFLGMIVALILAVDPCFRPFCSQKYTYILAISEFFTFQLLLLSIKFIGILDFFIIATCCFHVSRYVYTFYTVHRRDSEVVSLR